MGLNRKFQTARFHVSTGPQSLFDRVRFQMSTVNHLALHGDHYRQRTIERNVPPYVLDKIDAFDANEWKLVMCEVRADKGQFINSTWELNFDGYTYRITIGYNDFVMTVIKRRDGGRGQVVTKGELYNFVDKVNRELNLSESNQTSP